jgi:hypothetical protein
MCDSGNHCLFDTNQGSEEFKCCEDQIVVGSVIQTNLTKSNQSERVNLANVESLDRRRTVQVSVVLSTINLNPQITIN